MPVVLGIAAVVGVVGAAGVLRAADERTADVERVGGLENVLTEVSDDADVEYPAENYLLVGSDSREGVEEDGDDFAVTGGSDDVTGRRSDTIMVLRQEANGGAALMSIPRDLYVDIADSDRSSRINSAYNEGPERLAKTVSQELGIPIHHYVEVDFIGFKDIIDNIGGVEICVGYAARDVNSGLSLQPGCQTLDGVQALAYARSRYFEEWDGSDWKLDGRADLGRIERQQLFIRAAVDGTLRKLQSSPFSSGDAIGAVVDSVRIDPGLDPLEAAEALRNAAEEGLRTYAFPVVGERIDGNSVLVLGEGAEDVFAYFRGEAPAPTEYETGTTVPGAEDGSTG